MVRLDNIRLVFTNFPLYRVCEVISKVSRKTKYTSYSNIKQKKNVIIKLTSKTVTFIIVTYKTFSMIAGNI